MGTICTRARSYSAIVHVYNLRCLVPKHEYYSCTITVQQYYSCTITVQQYYNCTIFGTASCTAKYTMRGTLVCDPVESGAVSRLLDDVRFPSYKVFELRPRDLQ